MEGVRGRDGIGKVGRGKKGGTGEDEGIKGKGEGWKIIEKVCMSLQAKRRFFISISVKKNYKFFPTD